MHQRRGAGAQEGDVPACGLKSVLNGVDQGWISGAVVPADHHLRVICIQRPSQRLPRQPSQREGQASVVEQRIDGLMGPTRSEVHFAADAVGPKHVHGDHLNDAAVVPCAHRSRWCSGQPWTTAQARNPGW